MVVFPADRKSERPTAFTLMVRPGCPVVVVAIPVLSAVLAGTEVCGTRVLVMIPVEVVGLGGCERGFISFPTNTFQLTNEDERLSPDLFLRSKFYPT